jgi:hypothetical protein
LLDFGWEVWNSISALLCGLDGYFLVLRGDETLICPFMTGPDYLFFSQSSKFFIVAAGSLK